MLEKKIKVLIVDDSAVVRQVLQSILASDPEISVMATASDPFIAASKIRQEVPDVITLDIEMPRMDGLTFLQKIMSQHPIPVVIISSLADKGGISSMKALEYGALEIIHKPSISIKNFLEEAHIRICDQVKAAARARVNRRSYQKSSPSETTTVPAKFSADAVIKKNTPTKSRSLFKTTEKVVAVGASTGGTEALRIFLEALPHDAPGIVIVQHMPELFTKAFAKRLDDLCQITVKEAESGDSVVRGRALIAPGNSHMILQRSGARYYVEVKDGELVNRHRPSVDVLFRSVAQYAGMNSIGILMTGMGADGAQGLLEIKESGGYTLAQDEDSCVVFGMPKEAIKLGAAQEILPLNKFSSRILQLV